MTIAQLGRRAFGACAAAVLVACGGSLTTPNTASPAGSATRSLAHHDGAGCPLKRFIIATSQNGYKNKPLPAVLFFAKDASGNVSPAGEISGSNTMLSFPSGLAMDLHGNIYVANPYHDAITVYAAGSEGNVAPIRTIAGARTKLNSPTGLAVDSNDELYVANNPNYGAGWIDVYASNANGNAAPIRAIRGSKTHLYSPWGLAFDSQSSLYVANDDPNTGWITVYSPGAKGNVLPQRTIEGSATKLEGPTGLGVDSSGYIYVAQFESVSIFGPGANGNEAPVSHFAAPIYAFGIALDVHDNMYVTSVGYDDPPLISVIAAGTTGNEGHVLRTIEGKKTKLVLPEGIIVR